jgi:MOSC domain-containing protein YiiM
MEPVDVGDAGEPAVVEGVDGTWRVDPEALDRSFAGRTALLSPFDRLIHDRSRTAELFGFEYVLEMYKPAAKRRWGYFALPILHHDRLVGKLDATADRKAGVLRVNAVHRDVRFTRAITWGVDAEIASLAAWLGLTVEREAPAGRGHAPGAASRRSRNARSASLSVSLVAVEIEEHLHLVTSVARHGHDVRGSSRGRTAPVVSTAPTRQLPPEAIHAVRRSPRHGLRPDGTMDGVQIVRPPASSARLPRSVAACLAAILEIDVAEVPVPAADHPEPWIVWRNWLAQRGLGLVPIAEPQRFDWPGPWLAVLRAADGDGQVAAVAFGAPPGVAWHPADGPETFAAVEVGFVVAPADVALWAPSRDAPPRRSGTVEAIVIAPDAEGPMVRVQRAAAHAGRGLEGDRYFDDRGTFSNAHGRGHDLTLIEAEVLDALTFAGGRLAPEEARRNVVTRGIDLNALVGQRFRIGEVECFGQRLCEPCAHLEHLTEQAGKPGTLRALIHMGGLRVDLLTDGEIGVGAAVAAV